MVLLHTAGLPAASAQAWPNGYSYQRTITINHAKVPNSTQANFPVLISGTYSDLATTANSGSVTNANGFDVIFTSDAAGANVLAFEQELYSPATGQIDYWVNIPSLSPSVDTVIFMFYGNSSVTTDQSNKTGVWDSHYVGVWHLSSGGSLSTNDSTANGNNGTNNGATLTTGLIGGAASFNGSTDIVLPASASLNITSNISTEAWVKTNNTGDMRVIRHDPDVSPWNGFEMGVGLLGSGRTGFWNGSAWIGPNPTVNDNNWHFIAVSVNGSTETFYKDGAITAALTGGAPNSNTGAGSLGWQFNGLIDEIRVSNIARSSDWIATEYNNQSNPSAFFAMGSASGGTSNNPTITGLALTYGTDATLTVSGTNFGSSQGSSTLTINGNPVLPASWSASSIAASVPFGLANNSGTAAVTAGGVSSNAAGFTLGPQPLSTPWQDQDVGTVGVAGSAGYTNDVFTVAGSGAQIGGTADGMNIAYQSLSGDGTIIARLTAMNNGGFGGGQAGVMIRETLNANAASVFLGYFNYNLTLFLYDRATTGGSTSSQQYSGIGNLPDWMKLVRSGNTFTAFASQDGITWTQVGTTQTVSMASNVYVGLAVSSASTTSALPCIFDNVSVSTASSLGPLITAVTATTGSVGTQVVISGLSFGATQGSSVATLNGTPVIINNWSDTAITFTIPYGATSGVLKVTVTPSLSDSNYIDFTVESNPIPSPWLDTDIGATTPMGSASYTSGTFTVQAAGSGALNTADSIHFMYQPLSGDGVVTARLVSYQYLYQFPSAGVMIRESLNPGAVSVFANFYRYTASDNVLGRYTTGASPWDQIPSGGVSLPYWFQIVRSGNTFTTYGSSDGSHWTQIGVVQTITMATNALVGLAVDSGLNGTLQPAVFDNVSVTPVTGVLTPSVTTITPSGAIVGASVVLAGSNFGPTQATSTLTFSGVTATVTSWTPTALTVTVPTGAITGSVVVIVGGLPSVPVNFTILQMPTISSATPTSVGYGTSVTITGTNCGATQGSSTVSFNGIIATSITSWSATQIVALVPTGATTGPLSVTVSTVTSTSNPTISVYNPVITSITPPAAQPGTTVTISGTGLSPSGASSAVLQFNGTTVYFWTSWTNSSITLTVPAATSGPVTLQIGGATSAPIQFTVLEPLAVTSISPVIGAVGTAVTITGAGFGATQSTSTLSFYGAPATSITSWSNTQIVAIVPTGAMSGQVYVTLAGNSAYGPAFTQTTTAIVTDSLGNSSTYAATMIGGQWNLTNAQGSGCSTCTTRGTIQNTFDSNSNMLTTTDELGHTTTNTFDSNSNVLSTSQPINSSTATTSYTYNSFGEVLTAADPLGNVTTNTYDANGNLLTVTSPAPASGVAASVTTFAYNSLGELTQITDPLGHVSAMTYTSTGLIATITDAQSNVTTYAYDAHGNRTSVTDAQGHVTTFAYDSGDRLVTITYPPAQSGGSSTTSTFTYDSRGRRTSATDQNGKTTSYAYDTADRLTTVTDAASNVTTYSYDTENNLLGITDANSHTTNFTYDAFGRVTETTFPSSFYEAYAYDAIGNLTSKTDRKGQTIQYVYDALNRLTQKSYPDSTSAAYTYDLASRIQQVNDPTGTYAFAYDNMGRLIGTTTNYSFLSGTTFTNAYTYDGNSNRTGYTAPDGSTNTYTYDTLNRLTTLANSWAGSFNFTYDTLSRRTQMTRPNGVNTNYTYDSLSRLLSVLHQNGASTIDGATYTVDATGNRTSKTDQMAGVTSNYTYDSIYELTQVTQVANTTESYTYDPVGNQLSSLAAATSSYNSSNQLIANSNATYTYDANGSTTSKTDSTGTTSYTWDFENRIASVTLAGTGGTESFKYDPFGRRIQKGGPLGTTSYIYDGPNAVEDVDQGGNVLAKFSQVPREPDQILAELLGGLTSYYETDGLGSVTSLSSGAGALANTYTYGSFGQLTAHAGSLVNPFQYTGREFDVETGIDYYRERYFDPSSGRFLSEDPLRFKTSTNFYPYAANNPVRFNDPMGLSPADVQRLFSACQRCTDQLTKDGERRAGSGTLNGWANNMISSFTLGYRFSGCTRQADLASSCLNSPTSPLDSHWDFSVESVEWGFHHVSMGRSKDPSDPIVVCDPWRNTHYTIPSGPGPSSGGGYGGGGGGPF